MKNKFTKKGSFLYRHGKAKDTSDTYSNKKICFVATDKEFLMDLLIELSEIEDCYFVKLLSTSRDGMYLGRCFFTNDESVGRYWAKYKFHPKLMCNIQDDDFSERFRKSALSYDLS